MIEHTNVNIEQIHKMYTNKRYNKQSHTRKERNKRGNEDKNIIVLTSK